MRMLIITQAADAGDPVLGFFVGWIAELAKRVERVEVICLTEGDHPLPANVRVHSLGKERGVSRIRYLLNFYAYLWQLRGQYDTVFVHMNQEYVLLAGLLWRLGGKKILLWRNHAQGSISTRLAVLLAHRVLYTSPQSFTARFRKARKMPVGIDTDFFTPDPQVPREPHSILFLGRIAPVKNADVFIEALNALRQRGVPFSATVAGAALPRDAAYEEGIREQVAVAGLIGQVRFVGAVSQQEARRLYRGHGLYVNLTLAGSMDKTIFEALACKVPVLVANEDLLREIPEPFVTPRGDAKTVASRIESLIAMPADMRSALCEKAFAQVVDRHSVSALMAALENEL